MQIEIVYQVDDELYEAFQRLIPQLTHNTPPPTREDLFTLVRDTSSTLLAARTEEKRIIGILSLIIYRVPTGIRSIIEDVIVDISVRGQGIGEALMQRAIDMARQKGAHTISLTSNSLRVAANQLYLKMGFEKRETNAYHMKL